MIFFCFVLVIVIIMSLNSSMFVCFLLCYQGLWLPIFFRICYFSLNFCCVLHERSKENCTMFCTKPTDILYCGYWLWALVHFWSWMGWIFLLCWFVGSVGLTRNELFRQVFYRGSQLGVVSSYVVFFVLWIVVLSVASWKRCVIFLCLIA